MAALHALPDSLALLNARGVVTQVNDAWVRIGEGYGFDHVQNSVGTDYLQLCEQAASSGGRAAAVGIREVLAGTRPEYRLTYACQTSHGERWFQMTVCGFQSTERQALVIHHDVTALKRAEQHAEQAVSETQCLLNNLADAYFTLDTDWTVLSTNARVQDVLRQMGVTGGLEGRTLWAVFPELIGSEFERRCRRALRTQQSVIFEATLPRIHTWVEVRAYPSSAGLALFFQDVGQRKAAEVRLVESEAQYRRVVESIHEGLVTVDPGMQFTYVNPQMARMLAYSLDEIVGRPATDFVHPDAALALSSLFERRRQGINDRYETCWVRKDGRPVWLEVSAVPLRTAEGEFLGSLGVMTDITEHKRLRQERTLILESIRDGFFALDTAWRFTYVNTQAATLLRTSVEALFGRSVWEVFPETLGTEVETQYRLAAEEQRTVQFEMYFEPFQSWFEVRAYPSEEGLTVYFQNIDQRKADELRTREKNSILEMIAREAPLEEVLGAVCLMVEHQLPRAICSVTLHHEGYLYTGAAPSLSGVLNRALDGMPISHLQGAASVASATGELVVVEDVATHPAYAELKDVLEPFGIRAAAALPVHGQEGTLLGVVLLYHTQVGAFTAVSLEMLQKARRLVAIAVERHQLSQRLIRQALYDPLTQLPNRTLFATSLEQALLAAEREERSVAVLFIDLDDFKAVNDTLGHLAGDEVLRLAAERLATCIRKADLLSRLGGDEFTVLIARGSQEDAMQVAERIQAAFEAPMTFGGHQLYVRVSVGISISPQGGRDAETLLQHADSAMYRAKHRKLGSVVYAAEMNLGAFERMQLKALLNRAVENRELVLHYQPQYRLSDEQIVGVEALVRWNHPQLGMVSPMDFIPLAEETGLIVPIGTWVLQEACRQAVAWQQAGLSPIRMAVNVSALQFDRADFVTQVAGTLQDSGLDPALLELELTERVVMGDLGETTRKMQALMRLGVTLSMDDFGTGYSSLSYLARLPLNVLKIDRSFVEQIHTSVASYQIVKAIVDLAAGLGLKTVAEGIETPDELRALKEQRVTLGQGYLLSRPLPADRLSSLLGQSVQDI